MNTYKKLRDEFIQKKYRLLSRYVGRAIVEYGMIRENDKVLVALSGGKDSFACLHLLDYHRRRAPFSYEIIGCYVDLGFGDLDLPDFEKHLKVYEFPYVIRRNVIFSESRGRIDCFWCSWNRRKVLFQTCKELGCNKLAFGHNLDDIVQTTLLNIFFHGEISTSSPVLEFFGGEVTVIRPLCFLEERIILRFARALRLPLSDYECPYKKSSQRTTVKNIIDTLAQEYPHIKKNVFRALKKIRNDYLT